MSDKLTHEQILDLDTEDKPHDGRWRTGDVVRTSAGKLVLVGHVNRVGGACECCGVLNPNDKVVGNLFDEYYDARAAAAEMHEQLVRE